ncbi:MAG: hypothetical protein ACLQK8_02225 [Streptosporangiaceae bacterium]
MGQPIRSAVSLALAGAGSPACRQARYASNRAASTSRSLSLSGARYRVLVTARSPVI